MVEELPWLTVAQAARALGVSQQAIRARVKRGTLHSKVSPNSKTLLVQVDTTVKGNVASSNESTVAPGVGQPLQARFEVTRLYEQIAEVRERIGRLEGEAAINAERLTDRDCQIEQLRADAERERADHQSEVERLQLAHAAEIARLTSIIERHDREAERTQVLLQTKQQQFKLLTGQRQQPPEPLKSR